MKAAINKAPLPKPRAVLFDWDGTVVDSFDSIYSANNVVRTRFGQTPFSPDELREVVKIGTARAIFEKLYADRAQEALDIYYDAIPKLRTTQLIVYPNVEECVQAFKQAKIPLGVVSNMGSGPLKDEIGRIGFANYFDVVIGAGDAPRGKPDPAPVYLALERLGLLRAQAAEVWFVGDMETDEKAAKAAGCPFLYYTGGISDAVERKRMKAALKFDSYGELFNVLKDIL